MKTERSEVLLFSPMRNRGKPIYLFQTALSKAMRIITLPLLIIISEIPFITAYSKIRRP